MKTPAIDQVLNEMREVSAVAQSKKPVQLSSAEVREVDFSGVLKTALEDVNNLQQSAQALQRRFELGDDNVNLHDVMISLQKASLSFQTMVQVRNKLVSAYQEIMNTQL